MFLVGPVTMDIETEEGTAYRVSYRGRTSRMSDKALVAYRLQ